MLRDDDTATIAREVVTDPPDDDPMSIEVAASAAVISRALFGWLQTKVDIRVSRKDGKNEFSFYGEERGIAGEATFHDAAGIATRCPGAGVMDELRQAAFGLQHVGHRIGHQPRDGRADQLAAPARSRTGRESESTS
jgi:hypothetical protein